MLVTDFYQRPLSHLRRTTIRQMAFSEIAPSRRFLQIVVERSIELQISGHCLSSKSGVIEYGLALKRCSGLSLSSCNTNTAQMPAILPTFSLPACRSSAKGRSAAVIKDLHAGQSLLDLDHGAAKTSSTICLTLKAKSRLAARRICPAHILLNRSEILQGSHKKYVI